MTFTKGQKLKAHGLNMKCERVIVFVEFDHYLDKVTEVVCHDGKIIKQDCVVRTDGFLLIDDSSSLWV